MDEEIKCCKFCNHFNRAVAIAMKMTLILSNHTLNGALVTNLLNEKSRLHKNTAGKV